MKLGIAQRAFDEDVTARINAAADKLDADEAALLRSALGRLIERLDGRPAQAEDAAAA